MSSKPGLGASGAQAVFARRATGPGVAAVEGDTGVRRRGLVANLIEDESTRGYVVDVPLDERLADNPENPRRDLGDLSGLADSIANHGLIQPMILWSRAAFAAHSPDLDLPERAEWVIIAGHRRRAAGLLAGKSTLPAIIGTDHSGPRGSLTRALSENVHRKDLTPLEEARALATLRDIGLSQRKIAEETGISQAQVSKRLQLLELATEVQDAIGDGTISVIDALTHLRGLAEETQIAALNAVRVGGQPLENAVRQHLAAEWASVPGVANQEPETRRIPPGPVRPALEQRTAASPVGQAAAGVGDEAADDTGVDQPHPGTFVAEARARACALAARGTLKSAEILDLLVDLALDPPLSHPSEVVATALDWLGLPATDDPEGLLADILASGGKPARMFAVATALARREADLTAWISPSEPAAQRHIRRLTAWGVHAPIHQERAELDPPTTDPPNPE